MKLPLSRITEFLNVTDVIDINLNAVATGYSIDSRTIRPGELFFAVKGEKLDGHDFVLQAIDKGAIAAVVAHSKRGHLNRVRGNLVQSSTPVFEVEDTLVALQSLASAVRRLWGKPLVGVTGST